MTLDNSYELALYQNQQLDDITLQMLEEYAASQGLQYLGNADFPAEFPVNGNTVGPRHRMLVNLVCCNEWELNGQGKNVVFVIKTGSPVSYLGKQAMLAIDACVKESTKIFVNNQSYLFGFSLSPPGSQFKNCNILGQDFIEFSKLSPVMNFDEMSFKLQ